MSELNGLVNEDPRSLLLRMRRKHLERVCKAYEIPVPEGAPADLMRDLISSWPVQIDVTAPLPNGDKNAWHRVQVRSGRDPNGPGRIELYPTDSVPEEVKDRRVHKAEQRLLRKLEDQGRYAELEVVTKERDELLKRLERMEEKIDRQQAERYNQQLPTYQQMKSELKSQGYKIGRAAKKDEVIAQYEQNILAGRQ